MLTELHEDHAAQWKELTSSQGREVALSPPLAERFFPEELEFASFLCHRRTGTRRVCAHVDTVNMQVLYHHISDINISNKQERKALCVYHLPFSKECEEISTKPR